MYLYLLAFGCLCTGVSILETPAPSTTGAGQSACNPLFLILRLFFVRPILSMSGGKRRQMQSQYEIRAFIIEGCSGLFFAVGAFEPYRLADLASLRHLDR